jgi:hypothetical protein
VPDLIVGRLDRMKAYDWMLLFKRTCMAFCALFLLVVGIVLILATQYSVVRSLLGLLVVALALYYIWHALFGSRSDVEDL